MRLVPALDVRLPADTGEAPSLSDLLVAMLDEFEPTGVVESEASWRVFFQRASDRDRARVAIVDALGDQGVTAAALAVPDEDWARRSQAALRAVRIGDIVVAPPWDAAGGTKLQLGLPLGCRETKLKLGPTSCEGAESSDVASGFSRTSGAALSDVGSGFSRTGAAPSADPLVIVIEPSMAFGTGHHASTRLCLRALQRLDVRDRAVLDVGTGSGVLAIAAARLGARRVVAIDRDPEAIACARANLTLNSDIADQVELRVGDFSTIGPLKAHVVVANLTGVVLRRHARELLSVTAPGGSLIVSGLTVDETHDVISSFGAAALVRQESEDEWMALQFTTDEEQHG